MTRLRLAAACGAIYGLAALSATAQADDLPELGASASHARTALTLVEQLRNNHYLERRLNDDLSSEIFNNYLQVLDEARLHFTAGDIAEFEPWRHKLDDALRRGNLTPAFSIFNRYQARLRERLNFMLAELDTGLEQIDFSLDEDIVLERVDAPWPADTASQDALWRKRLKASVLGMKLNGKTLAEIQETLGKRYRNRLKQLHKAKSEDAFSLYANAVASTYDPHTSYFSPRNSQNFSISMSLSLEGIGAVLRSEDDYTAVVRLVPAGPAAKSGKLKPSDRITGVGQGRNGPMIDVVGWRLDDVVELIRGPKDSTVRLEVASADADASPSVVQLVRQEVKLEEQAANKRLLSYQRGGRDYRIGVIEIPTFYVDFRAQKARETSYRSTTSDVRRLIRELEAEAPLDGLVIDLRNNGGGSLQEADKLTGLFLPTGPTVQVKSARRPARVYRDTNPDLAWEGPLAVMVNRLSASASEIFAGAMQDYERGVVIGSRTFGKGTVQTMAPLNQGQLKITAAKFYRVSGESTQHQGVLPDIEFPALYDIEHVGESSLDNPMLWDSIRPVAFSRQGQVQAFLPQLLTRLQARTDENPDFIYLRALVQHLETERAETRISLNEAVRQAEKAEAESWRLGLENALRQAKGEPLLASLEALEEETEATDGLEEDAEEAEPDPLLLEAGEVLLDLIGFSQQWAMADEAPNQAADATQLGGAAAYRP